MTACFEPFVPPRFKGLTQLVLHNARTQLEMPTLLGDRPTVHKDDPWGSR
jgi:hypothetical protein